MEPILEAVLDAETDDLVDAYIHYEISHDHLDDYDRMWIPEFESLRPIPENMPIDEWQDVEDAHWNWRAKVERALSDKQAMQCALTVEGVTQGLMIVKGRIRSLLNDDMAIPYLAYISTAPWNRGLSGEGRRLRHVGFILMKHAILYSREQGFGGRLGLHALPGAVSWYQRLGFYEFGSDSGVQDPSAQDLVYFELDVSDADALLE